MRVTKFEQLPAWLQSKLFGDWYNLNSGHTPGTSIPPIRDAEYRVYRIGELEGREWWGIDAGTGGVSISSEQGGFAYGEPSGLEPDLDVVLHQMISASFDPISDQIESICNIIYQHGIHPKELYEVVIAPIKRGDNESEVLKRLVGVLYDGSVYGMWLMWAFSV